MYAATYLKIDASLTAIETLIDEPIFAEATAEAEQDAGGVVGRGKKAEKGDDDGDDKLLTISWNYYTNSERAAGHPQGHSCCVSSGYDLNRVLR
uniref:Uncharacterized protein n=1 Tax=Peronospora matthiolae TaxID=2874970 RepID=A0AAV1T4T7_9STRA